MPGVVQLGAAIAAGLAGMVLHELTHWLAARLRGYDAVIDWRALETRWQQPPSDAAGYRAIAGAPLLVGTAAALAALMVGNVPWYAWVGLGVFWLWGSQGDIIRVLKGPRVDYAPMPIQATSTATFGRE